MTVLCEQGHETEGMVEKCPVCKKWLCKKHLARSKHDCKQSLKKSPRPTPESLEFI